MAAPGNWTELPVRAAIIAVLGTGIGLAANPLTPRPVPLGTPVYPASASGTATCSAPHGAAEPTRITQSEARKACDACSATFVDARGENEFAQGHIPGAIHLPPSGHPDEQATFDRLRGTKTIIVYDSDVGCGLATGVADRLARAGLGDVRVMDGSWTQWESSGGPAESGACEQCTEKAARSTGAVP
jgi:3-mercaptopyruvate sulfurtransferase SseA